ncbi:hypothetical protein [Spirosoma sp. KUDC1026]|uniref:hypothetical protein n=1 Tax=Spirosoma sp. KUDC1026 TaxID=2745947 RepID=UPI00159BE4FB|nr:hypothetical protein [Spirosoma sp. KUDC1026]QKZ15905.1 hypothetical protein HU175_24620 [Spirosoma sp. KUDC1026]
MNDNRPTPAEQTREHFNLTHSAFSAQLKARFPDGPVKVQKQHKQRVAEKLAQIFRGVK